MIMKPVLATVLCMVMAPLLCKALDSCVLPEMNDLRARKEIAKTMKTAANMCADRDWSSKKKDCGLLPTAIYLFYGHPETAYIGEACGIFVDGESCLEACSNYEKDIKKYFSGPEYDFCKRCEDTFNKDPPTQHPDPATRHQKDPRTSITEKPDVVIKIEVVPDFDLEAEQSRVSLVNNRCVPRDKSRDCNQEAKNAASKSVANKDQFCSAFSVLEQCLRENCENFNSSLVQEVEKTKDACGLCSLIMASLVLVIASLAASFSGKTS